MKKAQAASNAAAFVAIVTVLIILYILFLPPDIREGLLNDGTTNIPDNVSSSTSALFQQQVGKVAYLNTNEKSYELSTVPVKTPTQAQLIKGTPQITVKSALFDNENAKYDFDLILTVRPQIIFYYHLL
jgi:hypothetical protein